MTGHGAPVPQAGLTVWFTGLPSSGKTTLSSALAGRLRAGGRAVEVLDGDEVRTHLSSRLGFSREDRVANILRVGFVANLLARNGVVVLCALVSPYREARDEVRRLHDGRFFEVHVAAPVGVCAARDVKGLYERQRSGALVGLTGIDDPYEPPLAPEVAVPTHLQSVEESVELVWRSLPDGLGG